VKTIDEQRRSGRIALIAICAGVVIPALLRLAHENGWRMTQEVALTLTVIMALGCIFGGYVAYREARNRVRSDRKNLKLDG
jgi:disulfide bond formation protein DsbB